MKIIFNGTIFYKQKYGGISRYFYNLANELINKKIDFKIVTPFHKNLYLKDLNTKYKTGMYIKHFPDLKIIDKFQIRFSNYYISKIKPSIVHETYYSENVKKKNSLKVLTVYDLIHEKFPHLYSFSYNKKKSFEDVDFFICISETTKNDLKEIYDISDDKIKVIYLGADHMLLNQNKIDYDILSKPYILYVGSRKKYKDFQTLIKAYSNSKILSKDYNIVCFGGGFFSTSEKKSFNELKISKNLINLQGDDQLLYNLYKNSRCFVSTSLYEGFGMPIIEAMYCKCPVILSDCSTHKEIARGNAIYFNKSNYDDLMNVFERDLYSDNKLNNLNKAANSYVKNFNWKKCAKETLEVYNKIII